MLKEYKRDTDSNSWLDRYRPRKLSDLNGSNKINANKIISWLNNFEKEKIRYTSINIKTPKKDSKKKRPQFKSEVCTNMLILGPHGCGKTSLVEVLLKSQKYSIKTLNFSSLKNKNRNNNVSDTLRSVDILSLIKQKKRCKIAIIIDNLESITSTNEKKIVEELLKENKVQYKYPIILISGDQHYKLLTKLTKKSQVLHISYLNKDNLINIVDNIAKKEEIFISDFAKNIIVNHSQYDIGRLIIILQELKYIFENDKIEEENIKKYLGSSKRKDLDKNLFFATKSLLYSYTDMNRCSIYYENDKVIIPLMIHENYVKYINRNIKSANDRLDVADTILTNLSYGDVIENYIYSHQYWNLQEVQGFYTCTVPSYTLETKRSTNNSNDISLVYSKDLNKTSIKNINKKNICIIKCCFPDSTIDDYIYMNKIVKELILNSNYNELQNIIIENNMTFDDVEALLKIDKIDKIYKTNGEDRDPLKLFKKYRKIREKEEKNNIK